MTTDYRREATGRLGAGEKLPRATTDADREFFERSRKLSPKFPDVASVLVRRQMHREMLTARILLFGMAASILWSILGDSPMPGAVSFAFCAAGFIAVCLVAGNRAHDRAGASGNPF